MSSLSPRAAEDRRLRRPAGRRGRIGAGTAALACATALLTGLTGPAAAAPATSDTAAARVDNPYVGAVPYVNPEWSAHAAGEPGGAAVSGEPTAVWLDSIASINGEAGGMGLKEHLDTALAQGAGLVQLVLYDLPGRDCGSLTSDGELGPDEIDRYEAEYIDPIAAIVSDPAYADLRIVTIVEPGALESLVLHTGSRAAATPECDTMKANGNYLKGIGYALTHLGALSHVYAYLDAGYHGSVGWADDSGPLVTLLGQAAQANGGTFDDVAGFIVNTADYGVLHEEYFTVDDKVNGVSVIQSRWVDWNQFVDELPFALSLRQRAIADGFSTGTGILVDTSRNGWGGPKRPTGPGPSTDVNAYVDGGRLDRRVSYTAWCNQDGAGLGERPTVSPQSGIDAYVWAKPPGESDGPANNPGAGLSNECDPDGNLGPIGDTNHPTGALPGAPGYGEWFPTQFRQLLANAWPPVD
ncbi:glycoside hydrolase family 6 protein [Streptomyces odontomachi]|uniref:glycoside hydrolase family 6 protein n=1 Tax=Streptomyces odontomachi TaxID=2944940 RepID=UPI0027E2570E|nr:glycoside hydrolase family 6 protein [Streptomyces sp. ODS25]